MFRQMLALSAVIVLLFTASGAGSVNGEVSGVESFRPALAKLFPKYAKAQEATPFAWRLFDADGKELGVLHLEDAEKYPRKDAYSGTIEVGVVTASDGKIAGVVLGKHQETPSFIARLDRQKFFQRWNGVTLAEAQKKKVDAVTRVTYSSEAIISGVHSAALTAFPEDKK